MFKPTMNQMKVIVVFMLFIPCILLLYGSPDVLTLVFVAVMALLCAVGVLLSLLPLLTYGNGFHEAYSKIERLRAIQPDRLWDALFQGEHLFQVEDMDKIFYDYKLTIEEEKRTKRPNFTDLDDLLDTRYIELKTWKSVVQLIPNTQTGIGILGTFVGLLAGIGNIGFSSAETVVTSVQSLLNGINVAFYTSIAGVILSIIFNIIYKIVWSMTSREMEMFYRTYHTYVRRSVDDSEKDREFQFQREVITFMRDMRERELLNL